MDFDQLINLLPALRDQNVEYILVGGIALGLHGLARATEDVDLFVDGDADNTVRPIDRADAAALRKRFKLRDD